MKLLLGVLFLGTQTSSFGGRKLSWNLNVYGVECQSSSKVQVLVSGRFQLHQVRFSFKFLFFSCLHLWMPSKTSSKCLCYLFESNGAYVIGGRFKVQRRKKKYHQKKILIYHPLFWKYIFNYLAWKTMSSTSTRLFRISWRIFSTAFSWPVSFHVVAALSAFVLILAKINLDCLLKHFHDNFKFE